ncbi:AT-rich interactive domain-containing protein 5 [Abeliophyllum distichum]|uniref:AT-rich interactive domain-containing protein 5 n=1 Tax=Abeliophyllum distichum TaxID=126358 RepID=A0ABD1QAX4_9LAMI
MLADYHGNLHINQLLTQSGPPLRLRKGVTSIIQQLVRIHTWDDVYKGENAPGKLLPKLWRSPRFFSDFKMDKSDVGMENDKKQPQNSENKLLDAKVESRGEELISAASGTHKANASVNEADNAKNVADDRVDEVNGQTAAQTNGGGVKEENFAGNGMEGGNAIENMMGEEKPAEIVAEKKPHLIGREDGNPVRNVSEEEKLRENTLVEKISRENGQLPTELSPIEAPLNEGDPAHGEDEKMADLVHENEDETVKDKLKEPGNEIISASIVTDGNAKLSETAIPLNESDPAQVEDGKVEDVVHVNEDETVKDKLKEPDNEIVSGSTTMDGNAKSSETATPLNEGDHAKGEDEKMADMVHENEDETVKDKLKEPGNEIVSASTVTDGNAKLSETAMKSEVDYASLPTKLESATPNSLVKYSTTIAGDHSEETVKTFFSQAEMVEGDDGAPEDQVAFMKELERFYREKSMDFKPLKFYGQPLNCLKLWRAVIRLGGYDRVTGLKLWRQVGESFHPPKTCTTVSWTFRIFYEKSLLEYERHKTQSGELQLPDPALPEAPGAYSEGNGYQGSGSGSGRARRDAAARAMQGWHAQRLSGHGEVGEPIIKDKNLNNVAKREKNLKSIGSLKQKRPNEEEHSVKAARTETSKQLVASVIDVGPPADWVKINVRQTKDCFEVYALVPGLLREEVRVQSDPAGRLVITGQPEQPENPWGITAFRKVVSFPAKIDPVHTSAVVSLHGRLFVRVPFEQ